MDLLRGFRQLKTLGETGNYRKAAARLGMTHSALSQSIARLEQHYGAELFVRGKTGTVPTALGRRLLESASVALAEMERAERDMQQMRDSGPGLLVIGADPILSETVLTPVLVELTQRHPDTRVCVHSYNWKVCVDALKEKRIDLYVGLQPEQLDDAISWHTIPLAPPRPLVRKSHPLVGRTLVTYEEAMQYPILVGDAPEWMHEQFRLAWAHHFKNVSDLRDAQVEAHDMGLMRQLILHTDAIALVSTALFKVAGLMDQVGVLPLERYPMMQPMKGVVAKLRDYPLAPVADQFEKCVIDVCTGAETQARHQAIAS